MKTKIFLITLLLPLSLELFAQDIPKNDSQEDPQEKRFSISATAGEMVPVGDFSDFTRPEVTLGLEAGYRLNKHFTLIADFAYTRLQSKGNLTFDDTPISKMIQISLGVKMGVDISDKFYLYSKISRGMYNTDKYDPFKRIEESENDYGGAIGIGSDYTLSNGVLLFLESNYHNVSGDKGLNFLAFQGGATINF